MPDSPVPPPSLLPVEVDARGQRCPMPVVRLAAALAGLPEGATVLLRATDPAARSDVPAFCRMRGLELVSVSATDDDGGHTAYLVRQVSASTGAAGRPAPR